MRNHIFVELANEKDAQQAAEWLTNTAGNLFDPAVMTYPVTNTVKAMKNGKPLIYLPYQTCFVLDSLAICPENGAIDTAQGLKALTQTIRWEAHKAGHGEMLFQCSEPSTVEFCQHHGFTEVGTKMFRMRLR